MLRDEQDAYGHAMWDALQGVHSHEILERRNGHIAVIGCTSAYFAGFGDWAPHEREAVVYARGRVLDVGCGAGRLLLHLQEKGHAVLGIDNSPLAIKVCRQRGVEDARVLSVTQISSRLGVFDTVLLFGGTFGLLSNLRRGRWLLRRFHRMTSTRGRIIAQSCDPHRMAPAEAKQRRAAGGAVGPRRKPVPGEMTIRMRYKGFATPWQNWLVVSPAEMRTLLTGTGWKVRNIIDSKTSSYIAIIDKDRVWAGTARRSRGERGGLQRSAGRVRS